LVVDLDRTTDQKIKAGNIWSGWQFFSISSRCECIQAGWERPTICRASSRCHAAQIFSGRTHLDHKHFSVVVYVSSPYIVGINSGSLLFASGYCPCSGRRSWEGVSPSFHSRWYPIVRCIFGNHFASARPIASCGGMITFSDALFIVGCPTKLRQGDAWGHRLCRNRRFEDKATRLATPLWSQTIRGLCDERVRAEGKGTALGTALGVT
jgi:hypothetical protein